jgi:cell division protein FtsL
VARKKQRALLTGSPGRYSGEYIYGEKMTYEGYLLVLLGIVIVIQLFIIYLMNVRIRQLLREIDTMHGKIKITDAELENLITRVEEFKRGKI